ncbi:MAG: hypothetical protein E4H32_01030 [Nitrospirales bacterium]|nr:MAG: hypothetical protein E4H32_01030 [Nitrospirales bacterium]
MFPTDPIQSLRQEFRTQLEAFYTHLKLAPPYHSIEKAIQHLANTLRTKPETFQQVLLRDSQEKWAFFEKIFEASGLSRKHRGIITQLAQNPSFASSGVESLRFLRIFTNAPSPN